MVSWVASSNGVGKKWRTKDEAHTPSGLPATAFAHSRCYLPSSFAQHFLPAPCAGLWRASYRSASCSRAIGRLKADRVVFRLRRLCHDQTSMTRQKKHQHSDDESSRLMPYPPPGAWSASKRPKENDWEIGIFGDLTDKQTELFQQLMEVPRNSHGTIFFDSGGGSIYCGLALATIIKLRGLRAIGVVA